MNFRNLLLTIAVLLAAGLFLAGCGLTETFDDRLQAVVTAQGIRPYEPPPPPGQTPGFNRSRRSNRANITPAAVPGGLPVADN